MDLQVAGMKTAIQAWKKAAVDLGIEIDTPFFLEGHTFPLLLRYFGSEKGTIVFDIEDIDSAKSNPPGD
jgi:hypothetical protein